MALNLPYKIKKFFQGEFGIVERIEPPTYKYTFGQNIKCLEDDEGNLPKKIFIRNSLGELIVADPLMGLETRYDGYAIYQVYKQYSIGDNFP